VPNQTKEKAMQKYQIYSIRDSKAGIFNTPFYQSSHGEAERSFHQLVRDPKSTVSQYPEDFDLYHLGTYDDQSGKMELLDTPAHMIKAVQYTAQNKQELN